MPTAPSIVESMTEMTRIRSTFTPDARANSGLEPTAVMAVPVLLRMNTHTRKAMKAKNKIIPVGT